MTTSFPSPLDVPETTLLSLMPSLEFKRLPASDRLKMVNTRGESLAVRAVTRGHLRAIRPYLSTEHLKLQSARGKSLLYEIGYREELDTVLNLVNMDLLLELDLLSIFDPFSIEEELGYAIPPDITHWITAENLTIPWKSGESALTRLARLGRLLCVRHLLREDHLAERCKDGQTVLHHAAASGGLKPIRHLITRDMLLLKNKKGATVAHVAGGKILNDLPHLITGRLLRETDNNGTTVAETITRHEGSDEAWEFIASFDLRPLGISAIEVCRQTNRACKVLNLAQVLLALFPSEDCSYGAATWAHKKETFWNDPKHIAIDSDSLPID